MLENQAKREPLEPSKRLELLARKVRKAVEALEDWKREALPGQLCYQEALESREEALAAAETLLLLAAREAYPLASREYASQALLRKLVESIALANQTPIKSAEKF